MKISPKLKGVIGGVVASAFLIIGLNATINNPAMSASVHQTNHQELSSELQPMTIVQIDDVKPFISQNSEEFINKRKVDAENVRSNLQVLNSVRSIRADAFNQKSPLSSKPTI